MLGLLIFIARSIGGILLVYAGFNLLRDYIRYEPPEPQPSPLVIAACFAGAIFLLLPYVGMLINLFTEISKLQ